MHKDLENRLKENAREILGLNDQSDLKDLTEKVLNIYNDLIVLSYLKKHPVPEPQVIEKEITPTENVLNQKTESADIKEDLENIFVPKFDSVKEDMSQKEEFKDTVTIEETQKLFESHKPEGKQLSLHDKLLSSSIQVGLNDRIAFVNRLFNYSQTEFNKTLRVLNACKTREEAFEYIKNNVKPKYNWEGKEDLEERLYALIDRKFL